MNYQKEMEKVLETIHENKPGNLLLHSCCAPCSSYVLEYLSNYFKITVLYYNPNIYPPSEYQKRVIEQKEFIKKLPAKYPITFLEASYDTADFYNIAKGLEKEKEGGERCFLCYRLRLEKTAQIAEAEKFDYFTTTLSISPLKNAQKLNDIGQDLAKKYQVSYLPSDFKKKNGYKRSTELSSIYGLYRQNYCGCIYSIRQDDTKSE